MRDELGRRKSFGRLLKELDSFDKNVGISGTLDGINGGDPCVFDVERLRVDTIGDIVRERSVCDRDAMLTGVGGTFSSACDELATTFMVERDKADFEAWRYHLSFGGGGGGLAPAEVNLPKTLSVEKRACFAWPSMTAGGRECASTAQQG